MRAGNRERSAFREGNCDTAFPDNTQPKGKRGLVGSLLFSLHGGHGRERRNWLNISAPFLILNQNYSNSLVGKKTQNNKKTKPPIPILMFSTDLNRRTHCFRETPLVVPLGGRRLEREAEVQDLPCLAVSLVLY